MIGRWDKTHGMIRTKRKCAELCPIPDHMLQKSKAREHRPPGSHNNKLITNLPLRSRSHSLIILGQCLQHSIVGNRGSNLPDDGIRVSQIWLESHLFTINSA